MQLWRLALISTLSSLTLASPSLAASALLCPPPSALVKDSKTLLWSTPQGEYKSYAPSFSKHANAFIGAQWQGVKVGNVFCLYQGDVMTFTVSLQYVTLVQEPATGKWEANINGIRNCHSAKPDDCPFTPVASQPDIDVNQQLKELNVNVPSSSAL